MSRTPLAQGSPERLGSTSSQARSRRTIGAAATPRQQLVEGNHGAAAIVHMEASGSAVLDRASPFRCWYRPEAASVSSYIPAESDSHNLEAL